MLPRALASRGPARHRRLLFDAAILLATLLLAAGAVPAAFSATGGGEPVVAIFAPWVSSTDAVERSLAAGRGVLRVGRLPSVVVLAPDEAGSKASRPAGVLALLPLGALTGCLDAATGERA